MTKDYRERTLVVIKPDAVKRGLIGEITARFERAGLNMAAMKMVWLGKKQVDAFYPSDKEWILMLGKKNTAAARLRGEKLGRSEWEYGKLVREWLLDYISSGPCIPMVLEGIDAIYTVRKLIGPTDIAQAQPGTVRGDYSTDTIFIAGKEERANRNVVHASGNAEEAKKEIAFFFSKKELA